MFYGVYVKHKSKFELNGTFNEAFGKAAERANAHRTQLLADAKQGGYPVPFVIIRVEPSLDCLPEKF